MCITYSEKTEESWKSSIRTVREKVPKPNCFPKVLILPIIPVPTLPKPEQLTFSVTSLAICPWKTTTMHWLRKRSIPHKLSALNSCQKAYDYSKNKPIMAGRLAKQLYLKSSTNNRFYLKRDKRKLECHHFIYVKGRLTFITFPSVY